MTPIAGNLPRYPEQAPASTEKEASLDEPPPPSESREH